MQIRHKSSFVPTWLPRLDALVSFQDITRARRGVDLLALLAASVADCCPGSEQPSASLNGKAGLLPRMGCVCAEKAVCR
eukprot:scaffold22594_cov22-Tisochrysis_lutea.AAC.2